MGKYSAVYLAWGALLVAACAVIAQGEKTQTKPSQFVVYDNMVGGSDRPDPAASGLDNCNIIYSKAIWHDRTAESTTTPDETAFKSLVTKAAKKPGPIVIDIEELKLSGDKDQVTQHFKLFMTLIQWAHEATPGRMFGYYGQTADLFPSPVGKEFAAESKKLAAAVDAYFPSMYVHDDDRKQWTASTERLIKQAHELGPDKPVFIYLMPYYHGGSPKANQYIDGDYWSFQLHEAKRCGADGVVIWEGSSHTWTPGQWWPATVAFVKEIKGQSP